MKGLELGILGCQSCRQQDSSLTPTPWFHPVVMWSQCDKVDRRMKLDIPHFEATFTNTRVLSLRSDNSILDFGNSTWSSISIASSNSYPAEGGTYSMGVNRHLELQYAVYRQWRSKHRNNHLSDIPDDRIFRHSRSSWYQVSTMPQDCLPEGKPNSFLLSLSITSQCALQDRWKTQRADALACAIQNCLTKNNYSESKCNTQIKALYQCCTTMYARLEKEGKNKEEDRSESCPLEHIVRKRMEKFAK